MYYILSLFPFTRLVYFSQRKYLLDFIYLFRTEDFGSECEVFAGTSNTLNGKSGIFMSDMKETRSSEESYDVEKAKRLWDLSEQWTHLTDKK